MQPPYKDMRNVLIEVGDTVAYSERGLCIGTVLEIHNVGLDVQPKSELSTLKRITAQHCNRIIVLPTHYLEW